MPRTDPTLQFSLLSIAPGFVHLLSFPRVRSFFTWKKREKSPVVQLVTQSLRAALLPRGITQDGGILKSSVHEAGLLGGSDTARPISLFESPGLIKNKN